MALLNKHLAVAIDLHAQMKQAHRTVRGLAFITVHELVDRASADVEGYSDLIAERAGALGGTGQGTIRVAAAQSFLGPCALSVADERQQSFAVAGALAAFGQSAREVIARSTDFGDQDMSDLFTDVSRGIDHQLWFVASHTPPK